MGPKLHEQLRNQVAKENASIQNILERLLTDYLGPEHPDKNARLHAALDRMLKKPDCVAIEEDVRDFIVRNLKRF